MFSKSSLPKIEKKWKSKLPDPNRKSPNPSGRPKGIKNKPYTPVLSGPVNLSEVADPWGKKIKKLKKNTKRAITHEVAEQVRARDVNCILCKMPIQQIHHCYYGPQSYYTPNRNDADQLVGLCNSCHHKLHNEGGNDYRQFCIDYLAKLGN